MRVRPIVVGVLLVASAAAADRVVPLRVPAAIGITPSAPSGGVLACPIATTGSGTARLFLANVGEEVGRARVFIRTASSGIITKRLGLAAGQIETLALDELTNEAAGLAVEWSGGKIIASHSLQSVQQRITRRIQLPEFMSVAQCAEAHGPELALAAARTDQLGDTTLALFNPGPAPADVSIAIRSDGAFYEPQRLQRRIVRPMSRRDFSLREFAFGADEIAVVVTMNSGRVVAEAYVHNREGAELISAAPPVSDGIAIAGASGEGVRLSIASVQRVLSVDPSSGIPEEIPVDLDGARYADGVEEGPAELPNRLGPGVRGRVAVPAFDGRQPVAYHLRPVAGRVAAAISWQARDAGAFDLIATAAVQPSDTWFAVLPGFGDGWEVTLLAVAAEGLEATARLEVVGPQARTVLLDMPPGTVRRIRIGTGAGVHAIRLTSDVPLAASFLGRSGGIAYGSQATSLRAANVTALDPQPSVGIGRARRQPTVD